MRRVFVLINNTGIGGSERRLGRLFAHMVGADPEAVLIINAGLWEKLAAAGLVTGREERVWRLPEPWGRPADVPGRGALAVALRKLGWVVFVGRLIADQAPVLFLEAVPAISRAVPVARFFLLGDGPLRPQVEQALDRLRLRGLVELGFRAYLAPVLGRARVFVSLQRQDNYPSQSLLAAMAGG